MKRFKEYDIELSQYKGTALFQIKQAGGSIAHEDFADFKQWDESVYGKYTIYPQSQVQFAVYDADDHVEWQKFRVGLKGLTTQQKLYALAWYFAQDDSNLRRIRVNNYLGALIRGGQLNDKLEIVK